MAQKRTPRPAPKAVAKPKARVGAQQSTGGGSGGISTNSLAITGKATFTAVVGGPGINLYGTH